MFVISDALLEKILLDDLPLNDCTTESLGIGRVKGVLTCFPKTDGIVSGIAPAAKLLEKVGLAVVCRGEDGALRAAREVVLQAEGSAEAIHAVYKSAQNIMEYSSGISNRVFVMLSAARRINPRIQVAVTRKHFPGAKTLSLSAAISGGAIVHRAGLSDSILVFDQHRVFCDDFRSAFAHAKASQPEKKVAIETDTFDEGLEFVKMGADIVQCERFSYEDLARMVREAKKINPQVILSAAGGVNETNAAQLAACGVDILVTSWPYFGRPFDIKMQMNRL